VKTARPEEIPSMERAVEEMLKSAGWFPGRSDVARTEAWARTLEKEGGFQISSAARRALEEYGGLRVSVEGEGLDVAKCGFWLDPALAIGEEDRFGDLGKASGIRLYPLGEAAEGNAFLGIDEKGEVYIVHDALYWIAPSIAEALEALILGKRSRQVASRTP
jgi:hypothetical protein